MSSTTHKEFSSQAAPEVLTALQKNAESEGRSIQAVLEEALREYIEHKEKGQLCNQTMDVVV